MPRTRLPSTTPITLGRAFLLTNRIILIFGAVYSALIFWRVMESQRSEVSLRFKSEAEVARREISGLLQRTADTVDAMTATFPLVLNTTPEKFVPWADQYGDRILKERPEQFNIYFAFEKEWAQRLFKKDGYVYVIAKNPEFVARTEFNSPSTFRRLTYTDPSYLTSASEVWYQGPLNSEGVHLTDLYFDANYMRRVMFSITKAFRDPITGKIAGVAGLDLTAGTFSKQLKELRIGKTGGVFLLDRDRKPITPFMGRDIPMLGFKFDPAMETKADYKKDITGFEEMLIPNGLQSVTGRDGKTYVTQTFPLVNTPFSVVAYQARDEVYLPAYWAFVILAFLGAGYLAVSIYFRQKLAIFVTRNVDRIWMNIDENREAIEKGDPSMPFLAISPGGPLEIARIGNHLNLLYDRLHHAFREVQGERDRAEQATRAKSRFLSIMSHEIRTPLNAMLGLTDVLLQSKLEPDQSRSLQVIRRSGQSLLRILNDILDFSRLEAGKLAIDYHEFSLFKLLHDLEGLMRVQAEGKNLRFTITAPEQNFLLIGDEIRIRQALLNLVGNAIKFTDIGSIELRVTPEANFQSFHFEVIDTGIGIPIEQQNQVFLEFAQGDSSVTRRYGGTGLGLSIAKQIVELLGGKLTVRSTMGAGSAFSFSIPLTVKSTLPGRYDAFASTGVPPAPTPVPLLLGSEERNILVVDDDPDNHQLIDAYVKFQPGLHVFHSDCARKALEILKSKKISLVLMDLQMPEIDGAAATQEIRRLQNLGALAPCGVVMLSANAFPDDVERSLIAGADEHVGKPLSLKQFMELMARYLSQDFHEITRRPEAPKP